MKKLKKVLLTGVMGLSILGGAFALNAVEKPSISLAESPTLYTENKANTIQVSGIGSIKVSPDMANINLGVQTEEKDSKTAQSNNAKIMDAVIKKVKELGIDEKDIITNNYSIYPKYNYSEKSGSRNIDGYTVNNNVSITVRDIDKVGSVLDAATSAGANISNGISFSVSDQEKYYNEALKIAVKNAKNKAGAIASAIDVTIGKPSEVIEASYGGAQVQYANYDMRNEMAKMAARSTPIEAGELEISATVNVKYEY